MNIAKLETVRITILLLAIILIVTGVFLDNGSILNGNEKKKNYITIKKQSNQIKYNPHS